MMRDLTGLVPLVFLLGPLTASAAPPTLTHLFPAGAPRGTKVEVTAAGTFASWPVKTWGSNGLLVRALPAKGKLEVTVAADATPGVGWVRVHDAEGASNLRPFVIGTLPEAVESEPNNDPKHAQAVTTPAVVNGRLERRGDVDCFAVTLKKGATLVAAVDASRSLHTPMDAVLQLLSADGFVLAQNNDTHGFDPFLAYSVPRDGTYTVRLFAFPAQPDASIAFSGGDNHVYRLTLTTGGYADHAWPPAVTRGGGTKVGLIGWNVPAEARQLAVSPRDDLDPFATVFHPRVCQSSRVRIEPHPVIDALQARPQAALTAPTTVCGEIPTAGVDRFSFTGVKGQPLTLQVEARAIGFRLNPVLHILDRTGKRLTRAEPSAPHRDVELTFTPPASDTYQVELRDLFGGNGAGYRYRLRIARATPDFDLTVPSDRFTLPVGKPLTVPVQVSRRHGFQAAVEVMLEGLPAGITARIDAAGARPGTATIPIVLTAEKPGLAGTFRIVGRTAGSSPRVAHAILAELKRPDNDPAGAPPETTVELWVSTIGPTSKK